VFIYWCLAPGGEFELG